MARAAERWGVNNVLGESKLPPQHFHHPIYNKKKPLGETGDTTYHPAAKTIRKKDSGNLHKIQSSALINWHKNPTSLNHQQPRCEDRKFYVRACSPPSRPDKKVPVNIVHNDSQAEEDNDGTGTRLGSTTPNRAEATGDNKRSYRHGSIFYPHSVKTPRVNPKWSQHRFPNRKGELGPEGVTE